MTTPLDPWTSVGKDMVEVLDRLGVIQAVKSKLVAQPDPALDKLVTALQEVSKIYDVLESEVKNLLSLYFDPSAAPDAAKSRALERTTLIALEGGQLAAKMRAAKGHSSKIENIYQRYLTPWFGRLLNPAENNKLFEFFHLFHGVDLEMVARIEEVANWLSEQAASIGDLVDEGKFDEANQRIKKLRNELRPIRRDIAQVMTVLHDLEAEFTQTSGAVGSA
jgi:hypothetical protein